MSIDLEVFRRLHDKAGPRFTSELVETFLFNGTIMMSELKYSRKGKSDAAFARTLRTMRNSSVTFGAMKLSAMALELEQSGIPDEPSKLEALKAEFTSAKAQLEELCQLG